MKDWLVNRPRGLIDIVLQMCAASDPWSLDALDKLGCNSRFSTWLVAWLWAPLSASISLTVKWGISLCCYDQTIFECHVTWKSESLAFSSPFWASHFLRRWAPVFSILKPSWWTMRAPCCIAENDTFRGCAYTFPRLFCILTRPLWIICLSLGGCDNWPSGSLVLCVVLC